MNLVTGASGLLGSHIVEQLCRRGKPVRALVRKTSDLSWLRTQPVELAYGDITEPESLTAAMPDVQCVYHAAARVGDWGPWEEFQRITIDGTANVIRAAQQCNIKRFIHISSISAYGYVKDRTKEAFDETTPLGQNLYRWAYYSRAKATAENQVWEAQRRGKCAFTVIRPSWLYGERDRQTLGRLVRSLRSQKAKLIGDGDNRLNVAHAANVAEACIEAADKEIAIGQAYNCSNDGFLTQRQFFNLVAAACGAPPVLRRVPYRVAYSVAFAMECFYRMMGFSKPPLVTRYSVWLIGRRCFFDTTKARQQLGWQSTIPYPQGIEAAVKAYLKSCGETA